MYSLVYEAQYKLLNHMVGVDKQPEVPPAFRGPYGCRDIFLKKNIKSGMFRYIRVSGVCGPFIVGGQY